MICTYFGKLVECRVFFIKYDAGEDMGNSNNKSASLFAVVSEKEAKTTPYPYIYVNEDGTVRELRLDERKYLETPFHPADGAGPYVKRSYNQRNGWGNLSGFCLRKKIPSHLVISGPPFDNPTKLSDQEVVDEHIRLTKEKGFDVIEDKGGVLKFHRKKT